MSNDSHAHDSHGAGEKKASGGGDRGFMVDRLFKRLIDYVSEGIARLIAFILIVVTIGALIGWVIAQRHAPFILVFAPAALGIIAYYERDIAILLFVGLLLFVVF